MTEELSIKPAAWASRIRWNELNQPGEHVAIQTLLLRDEPWKTEQYVALYTHDDVLSLIAELRTDIADLIEAVQPLLGCADYARENDLSGHEALVVTAGEARDAATTVERIEARAALSAQESAKPQGGGS